MKAIMRSLRSENNKLFILAGAIAFVGLYYYNFITQNSTILQYTADWGVDQGQTMLFWAFVFGFYCLFMLLYARQTLFRQKQITKLHVTIMGTWLFLPLFLLIFFQWFAHAPELNLYKLEDTLFKDYDKFVHLLTAFFLVILFGMAFKRRSAIIIIYMFILLFELFEILVNFYLMEFGFAYVWAGNETSLMIEIAGVIPDIFFDTVGAILGYLVIAKKVKK